MADTTHELKLIHKESVPVALEKAHRYRLLNEPMEAESICLDILKVDPKNQQAIVTLILALSDQFSVTTRQTYKRAKELVDSLEDNYDRIYYSGIIQERRAKASYRPGKAGSGHVAYQWLQHAMECYEAAAAISPADNDDAILRWNTCVRIIERHPDIKAEETGRAPQLLE